MRKMITHDAAALRKAAEARLYAKTLPGPANTMPDLLRLQHELDVHQIELEMQNEELRAARAEMEALIERYTDLYDFAPVGYFNLTSDGIIRLANLTGAKLLGVARAQLVGRGFQMQVAPADRPVFNRFLKELFVTGKRQSCEVRLAVLEARQRTVCLEATLPPAGNECRFVMLDVTERKQTEEQVSLQFSALSAAANGIVITDQNGTIEWVNPSFTKLTGYTAVEAIGQNPRLLNSGQHSKDFYAGLWNTVAAGNVWHGELINRRKDGRQYTEEMTITPVRGQDGAIRHFVAIKQDVTDRRKLEDQLRQAQKMEAIGTLAGGIAHDFNNILGAMFGFGYLLREDLAGNDTAREYVEEILRSANRAKELVQQILTFSRQHEQKPQVIKLDLVVREAIKFLRASLPANIVIELDLDSAAYAVLADPTQIYQVTMNLATNALHAMEGRPGRLTITLEGVVPDGKFLAAHPELKPIPYVRLTMADNGQGMDAKTRERIFEPFFTTKPVGQGTGLGLAVVHGIVKSHGGIITVESEVGQGTTFRLYFPAQPAGVVAGETGSRPPARGHGERILVVDDEPALTAVYQRLLDRLGFQTVVTNYPEEALRMIRKSPANFGLVITDMTMPGINGLDLARQIRGLRPDLRVILTSGFSPALNDEALRAAGVHELVMKPVTLDDLAAVVQRALKG